MKTVKTKMLAMLMAAVMVFAMAPLATGIAFADEGDVDAADAADAVEVTDVIDDTEEAEPQLEAAAVEKGELVIDLSNGPVTYIIDPANSNFADEMVMLFGAAGAIDGSENYKPWISMFVSPFTNSGYFDLDKDGAGDIKFAAKPSSEGSGSATEYALEAAAHRSIQTSITLKTPSDAIEFFKTQQEQMFPRYYTSMTIVLGKDTAKVKAANTLAVKGKTAKIKYKKLKKKNQTLKVSKVITLTNAGQGAVTYAKVKGNKKIKIAKSGKVTVKKKLKKGTYKVTVNVTAAGNDAYDGVTKAVTFKVKVK